MLYACWQQYHGALEAGGVFPAWKVRKTSLREVSNTEVQEPSIQYFFFLYLHFYFYYLI